MARLHEYEGKRLLAGVGLEIPRGGPAGSPDEARKVFDDLRVPVVVKIQAWTTGRASIGGVAFAENAPQTADHAARMLAMKVGSFPVTRVLVEEKLAIASEIFVSLSVDDRTRAPVLLMAFGGGTGIEGRAESVSRIPCDISTGPDAKALSDAVARMPLDAQARDGVARAAQQVFDAARRHEARSVEVNPLVVTKDGRVIAADCRVTIDDYAVFRHPELGIEIARELDHPPTELERTAYRFEQEDHRGTFFFAQMNTSAAPGSKGLIGFHGAGGGGSMMSMDAITNVGFTIANFCDTSGNPSPAKVYRAARVILSQPGLLGYFGSGSGVANQEQYWSAYGLAKAFWELNLDIPAVIRLGGNTEDRAVDILTSSCKDLPGTVEGYRKNDPPARIASRFAELVATAGGRAWAPRAPRRPGFVGVGANLLCEIKGGRVWVDRAAWTQHAPAIVARANGLLRDDGGRPSLTLEPGAMLAKDSDMIACEVECRRDAIPGFFVELDTPGL